MRRILVFLIALFFCSNVAVYGQSAYKLVRAAKRVKFKQAPLGTINRHLQAPLKSANLAKEVARLTNPAILEYYSLNNSVKTKQGIVTVPEIHIVTEFPTPILNNPSTLWGSYRYLRVLTSLSREKGAVNPRYADKWKHIFTVTSYNGVHHIVNKSTLKEIYYQMKNKAARKGEAFTVRLDDMQREAPASLHPFHGNPEYSVLFHNLNRQMALYEKGGIRAILTDYFNGLRELHARFPKEAPAVPEEVINNTLLEAKLWAETFQLKWK